MERLCLATSIRRDWTAAIGESIRVIESGSREEGVLTEDSNPPNLQASSKYLLDPP